MRNLCGRTSFLSGHGANVEIVYTETISHVHAALSASRSPNGEFCELIDVPMLQNWVCSGAFVAPGHVFETFELLHPEGVSPESFEVPDDLASAALQCKSFPGHSVNGREGCHGEHVSEPQQEPYAQALISSLFFSKLQPTCKNQARQHYMSDHAGNTQKRRPGTSQLSQSGKQTRVKQNQK